MAFALEPVRWQLQLLTTAAQSAPRCDTGPFWVVPTEQYISLKLLTFPVPPPSHKTVYLKLFFAGSVMPERTPCYSQHPAPAP